MRSSGSVWCSPFKGTGILNFAQGELVALGAYIALFFSIGLELPYWQVFILTLIVAAVGRRRARAHADPAAARRAALHRRGRHPGHRPDDQERAAHRPGRRAVSTFSSPLDHVHLQIGDVNINPQYVWITGCSLAIMAAAGAVLPQEPHRQGDAGGGAEPGRRSA